MIRGPGAAGSQDSSEEEQRRALRSALDVADLTLDQLCTRYSALGGSADLLEVDGHLQGLLSLAPAEVNVLAHALNERLDELFTRRRVPHRPPVRRSRAGGASATLLRLVEAAHTTPPDRLPALVTEAGTALGVAVTVHVADHEQRRLWPLLPAGAAPASSLPIDGSLPGRVFRTVRPLPSEADGAPRLWLPLLDGADRVGVLEVRVDYPAEVHDPALREECRWLAEVVGSLLASMSQYGDGLERPRRTRSRTPSAELLWQLLPPLTASSARSCWPGCWSRPTRRAGTPSTTRCRRPRSRWPPSTRWGTACPPPSSSRPRCRPTAVPPATAAASTTRPG